MTECNEKTNSTEAIDSDANVDVQPVVMNQYAADARPKWKKFVASFFPGCMPPDHEPDWCKDVIHINTIVKFGIRERFLLLISGRLRVMQAVATEDLPGRTSGIVGTYVMGPERIDS